MITISQVLWIILVNLNGHLTRAASQSSRGARIVLLSKTFRAVIISLIPITVLITITVLI